MDVFCVLAQIFLIIICLPMLDYLHKCRHMDVICIHMQIFLMILNVQRWIICAYEQVSHRDTDVFCVYGTICADIPNNDFDRPRLDYLRI